MIQLPNGNKIKKGETLEHTIKAVQYFTANGIGARNEVLDVLKGAGLNGNNLVVTAEKIDRILRCSDGAPNPQDYDPWNYFKSCLGLTSDQYKEQVLGAENFVTRLNYGIDVFRYKDAEGKLKPLPQSAREQLKSFMLDLLRSFVY